MRYRYGYLESNDLLLFCNAKDIRFKNYIII